jgi:hypothetical protein
MSYKVNKSDVGPQDQRQNLSDEMKFTAKDTLALVIAGLQLVLPIAAFFIAGLLLFFIIFQVFF